MTSGPVGARGAGSVTKLILAASLGNTLEFYEIVIYGYFAVTIAKIFSRRRRDRLDPCDARHGRHLVSGATDQSPAMNGQNTIINTYGF